MRDFYGKANEEAILPDDYTVTGIFDVGYFDYDANVIATSLENAQDLYNLGDGVHGLLVMLRDPYQAPEVQQRIGSRAWNNYSVTTWMQENSAILGALIVEKNVMFYLLFFIVACRRAVHLERANHVRRPENARDRDAQGARRDQPPNFRNLSGPKRHHRRVRRAGRLWVWAFWRWPTAMNSSIS